MQIWQQHANSLSLRMFPQKLHNKAMQKIIEYDGVTLMRNDFTVLENISLEIGQGEFIYVTGKVGSGKSTLLKSMYAEVSVETGNASVLDFNLKRMRKTDIPSLRRNIGFIFQEFVLLNDRDIFGNLDFVLQSTGVRDVTARIDRVQEALQLVGLKEKSYKMPFELSEGERQLAVIARAFLSHPPLILADEPTANLDNESGKYVIWLLYEYANKGATVIVATHNQSWLKLFPGRQLLCHDNKISEI